MQLCENLAIIDYIASTVLLAWYLWVISKNCFMSNDEVEINSENVIKQLQENKCTRTNTSSALPEKLPSMVSVLSPPSNTSSESQFCSVTKLITWIWDREETDQKMGWKRKIISVKWGKKWNISTETERKMRLREQHHWKWGLGPVRVGKSKTMLKIEWENTA